MVGVRDGVILAAGRGLLAVERRVLSAVLGQIKPLMDAGLKRPVARSGSVGRLAQTRAREDWAFMFSVELVLQVRQEMSSLDTVFNKLQSKQDIFPLIFYDV